MLLSMLANGNRDKITLCDNRRRATHKREAARCRWSRTSSSASPRRGWRAAPSSDGRRAPSARASPRSRAAAARHSPTPATHPPSLYFSTYTFKIGALWGSDLLLYFYIHEYTYFVSSSIFIVNYFKILHPV